MKLILPAVAALFVLLTLVGCQEEVAEPSLTGLSPYYALQLDRPLYYDVDSIILDNTVSGVRYDTSQSVARETLLETYVGADGQTYYRGERWSRPVGGTGEYRFVQTYTLSEQAGTLVRSEDNLTFTKLVSPLRLGVSWRGNAAFDETRSVPVGGEFLDVYNGWVYTYTEVNGLLDLPGVGPLDGVVTVTQAEQDTFLIDRRIAFEKYAQGIGLVERYIDARHTQCRVCCSGDTAPCKDLPWDEKAEKGYIIHQRYRGED